MVCSVNLCHIIPYHTISYHIIWYQVHPVVLSGHVSHCLRCDRKSDPEKKDIVAPKKRYCIIA